MDHVFTFLAMIVLLVLQGFFSGSEIALVNADKLKLRHRARQGHAGSRLVLRLFEKPEHLLATTLVGTNVCTVTLATLATVTMVRLVGEGGDLLAFALVMPLMLVFGEVVPKSVYQQKADALAPVVVYPLRLFSWLFLPVVATFSWFAGVAVRLISRHGTGQNVFVGREKIRTLLDSVEQAPSSEIFDHQRIRRAIRFSDTTAADVMIPLSDAVLVNTDQGLPRAVELALESGYNRLPVYDTEASRIVGVLVLNTWDLLDRELPSRTMEDFLAPAAFVPPSRPVEQLLPALQARADHMCVVVDEYGSAIGLVTVEDILEEVVGEIEDVDFRLHARHGEPVQPIGPDAWLVDAHAPVGDVNERLGLSLPSTESRTLGGLLIARLQRIPTAGESVTEAGIRISAVECDERMVRSVRVERVTSGASRAEGGP